MREITHWRLEPAVPPRARYSRTGILDAAVALTRADGIRTVTARGLATALGCSTGPVFTHFASMDALHEQLMDRIIALFVAVANGTEHADPLVGAGLGWLRFASEERRLYEAVFLTQHPWHAKWGPVRRRLAQRMATHPRYAHLDDAGRFALVGRASIIMHGLGVELWSGRLAPRSPADHERLLEELVGPVVTAALTNGWTADLHSTRQPDRDSRKQ